MESMKCKVKGCEKIVEGYNKKHCEFLMLQHNLIHRQDDFLTTTDIPAVKKKSKSKSKSKPKEEKKDEFIWKEVIRDTS